MGESLDERRHGNHLIPPRKLKFLVDVNHLQGVAAVQMILADLLDIHDGQRRLRRGPGNVQPKDVFLAAGSVVIFLVSRAFLLHVSRASSRLLRRIGTSRERLAFPLGVLVAPPNTSTPRSLRMTFASRMEWAIPRDFRMCSVRVRSPPTSSSR